jgi:hypothetical protein
VSPARQTIAACLIVQNEGDRLPAALASLDWCDEVTVVDGGSTDRTAELARQSGARVVSHAWAGFARQRNVAIDHSTADWIFEVDADERVSPGLRTDILRFLALPPPADAKLCVVPLRDHYLGRPLGPSARYPRYRHRLFRRGAYRHDESRLVHEGLTPEERTLVLRGDLDHEFAATWREALTDAWAYARLESGQLDPAGSVVARVKVILVRPALKVGFRLAVGGGWRDGWRGVVRIGLEAGTDAIANVRRAIGRAPATEPFTPLASGVRRVGSVRVAVVGGGLEAMEFLRLAKKAGGDVVLLTDSPIEDQDWLEVHSVPHLGPFHVARGLDAVAQVRAIDQIVVDRGKLVRRFLTADARGCAPPVHMNDTDPELLVASLERSAR